MHVLSNVSNVTVTIVEFGAIEQVREILAIKKIQGLEPCPYVVVQISVSLLRPLSDSHANPNEGFQASPSVDQQILVPFHNPAFKQNHNSRSTKRKKPELFAAFYLLTFFNGRLDAANHHGPDTHRENTSKLRTVDRYDLSRVFAVDVEGGSDRLWLEIGGNGSALSVNSMYEGKI